MDSLLCNSTISLSWELGWAKTAQQSPSRFIPAHVPGAVQLDIAQAENFPDFCFSDNYKLFAPYEDFFYTYRARFYAPELKKNQSLWFVAKGIDYAYDIFLNGRPVYSGEGMFSRVCCNLSQGLQPENELTIRIHPAPKRPDAPIPRAQVDHTAKPAVSYGWDWHPRLIPLGLWEDAFLEIRNERYFEAFWTDYKLDENLSRAHIRVHATGINLEGCTAHWELLDADGARVASNTAILHANGEMPATLLESPKLWWSHDHGTPYLYTSTLRICDPSGEAVGQRSHKVGFRRVRIIMNEGAWEHPKPFPKDRSVSPAQFELNGRRIFAKGSNWVNPEIFPGAITRARYAELLKLAKDAHFNCLRVWGGAIVNKESFYELADELGILIWQEFPLACNQYPDDPHYLKILEQEATAIILRLKRHACLALWCGGNELFNSWSKMTEQSLPLRLLNSLTFRLDPATPFNYTSPIMGMAHGHYLFRDMLEGEDVFQIFNRARHTAYAEFGVSGLAPVSVLEKIIPEEELFPVRDTVSWQAHHAFHAWKPERNEWLCPEAIAYYFGESDTLETLVERSQLMQAQGYKAVFEEARRQKPYCAMALNWCYCEPWPCAANNSLICYPAVPKPAYQAVADSCRPICASARLSKFLWEEGETFFCELFLLNDKYDAVSAGTLQAILLAPNGEKTVLLTWEYPTPTPYQNIAGPTARIVLPRWETDRFTLIIEDIRHPERSSQYTLAYHRKSAPKPLQTSLN